MAKSNEQYDMSGALFKNKFKKDTKHPDYTGNLVINGTEYRLAGWKNINEENPDSSFIRIKLSEPQPAGIDNNIQPRNRTEHTAAVKKPRLDVLL